MGRELIESAIRQRSVSAILGLLFDRSSLSLRPSMGTETELWDYKSDCPRLNKTSESAWASIAADILGFHNNKGGILFFGIDDSYSFCGATSRLDSKLFNDRIRKYLGDRLWIDYNREFIQADQRYLGIAIIPPRGPVISEFRKSAPIQNDGQRLFLKGQTALRHHDSTRIMSKAEAIRMTRSGAITVSHDIYAVDEPYFRILSPEYYHFVQRDEPCSEIQTALQNPRASIAAITGIGGVGKTALATWACLRAYHNQQFDFIVSITAKDRQLTSSGIQPLQPQLTSFEALLDAILEVLGFPEAKQQKVGPKEAQVRDLLKDSNGLLYVDNLETVDDARIVVFLDSLPVGVRAITTSRRTTVRTSVHPVELGPMTSSEGNRFISSLGKKPGFQYVNDLEEKDRSHIVEACKGIPLAVHWTLARSHSKLQALEFADRLSGSARRDDELLEFCFRRVFDAMTENERAVVQVLSLFQQPLPTEAILVGTSLSDAKVRDILDDLIADAIVQLTFDVDRNDCCYSLFSLTRIFVYAQVSKEKELEQQIRKRLTDWFGAADIKDEDQQVVVRELRQGRSSPEAGLLDLAQAAERREDTSSAQSLYEQAIARNPRSWRAARLYAEFCRHKLQKHGEALRFYEQAAANAPSQGQERGLIYREWAILTRDSGDPNATRLAIERLEIALDEIPDDPITVCTLADILSKKGHYRRVIELLEPLKDHPNQKTRQITQRLLLRAYEQTHDTLRASELKFAMEAEHGARAQTAAVSSR